MKVSIHQPMYIPWIPYFFKIIQSDIFVFFDDVQYPRSKSYNNRNFINTFSGPNMLSISIKSKSNLLKFNEVEIDNNINWKKKHWKSINLSYQNTKYFSIYKSEFEDLYLHKEWNLLSDFNIALIKLISKLCNLKTTFYRSSELDLNEPDTAERIINIVKSVNGEMYITGKGEGSLRYLNIDQFKKNNLSIKHLSYKNYSYNQNYDNFTKNCSILDLFFNYGENTRNFLFENSSIEDF